jgi:acyl dehydratase
VSEQLAIGDHLVGREFKPAVGTWNDTDTRLYAIAVGAGSVDPAKELQFTTQNSIGVEQVVLPSFGVIEGCRVGIGGPLTELPNIDLSRMLHGTQEIEMHRQLPIAANVVTDGRITAVWDKGSAAVVETETATKDAESGEPYVTCRQSLFFRGYGGWGGERGPSGARKAPDGTPPIRLRYRTRVDQALLYRLTGDWNPLHSDPTYARNAGFERPILHGLCTYGIVGRLLLNELADGDPARVKSFGGRFSAPTYPGDELHISVWGSGRDYSFAVSNDREEVVLSNGTLITT